MKSLFQRQCTPALSLSERERVNHSAPLAQSLNADSVERDRKRPPPLGGEGWGENSPNQSSRFEPLNRSRRREEAERVVNQKSPPRHLGGYQREVHGEGECILLLNG